MGVLGLGTMGSGIAQTALEAGFDVVAVELNKFLLSKGEANVKAGMERRINAGKMTQQAVSVALSKMSASTSINSFAGCDIVVEAVFENLETKSQALAGIGSVVAADTIVASNTSSISITLLSKKLKYPGNFLGMHFFNPVPVMKLLELVRGFQTADNVVERARVIGSAMGKEVVEVHDYPGFVSNRVLMPMINEAAFALMEGVASREDIDKVMRLGMNHPMGPLELADFIGLDVCLDIMNVLNDGFRDPKYRPCPLLVNMVNAGRTGRKSGEGFYKY